MIDVVKGFFPDFMTEPEYESQKQAVRETLKKSKTGKTRREVASEINEMPSSVSSRLNELVENEGAVKIKDWRECSEAKHSKKVNVYAIAPFRLQGLDADE